MKKILTILAAALMCFCAYAQIARNPSITNDPVDYTRLRLPTDEPALPVFYTLIFTKEHDHERMMAMLGGLEGMSGAFAEDKITLMGSLIHTWDITPEYVEDCIQHALKTSGIGSRAELARLYKVTPIFKDFTYTNAQFGSDMFGFVTGIAGFLIPSGTVASTIYGATTGAAGLAISNATGGAGAVDNALGTAGTIAAVVPGEAASAAGNGLSAIQILKLMRDQHNRDIQKWENRVHLLNMARIDYFYNLVNMYLRNGITEERSVWVLATHRIDKTMPFQFRRSMCSATWHINIGALKLVPLDNFGTFDFEGHYFGYLNADVSFDLSNYDKNFSKALTYEQSLGLKGDQGDLMKNAMDNNKDASYDIGGQMNFYRAMGYSISNVINNGSKLRVSYRSPIHIKIEAPIDYDEKVIETHPDYFWDAYETKYTEKELHWSEVMRAMGINIGGRDADVKAYISIHKGYTAVNSQTKEKIQEEEIVNRSGSIHKYIYNGKADETKLTLDEALRGEDILTTIPGGLVNILWTAEIKPAPRNAKASTEAQWRDWFKKYDLSFNFR